MGVQEEVIQELTRFEDVAYNYLESPCKYFQTRAKLVAKVRLCACVCVGYLFYSSCPLSCICNLRCDSTD